MQKKRRHPQPSIESGLLKIPSVYASMKKYILKIYFDHSILNIYFVFINKKLIKNVEFYFFGFVEF